MKLINIPNIITCCNIICGCLSVFYGLQGQVDLACLFIVLGAFFDFFDGMTARAMGISGPIGKELDSLADMVSFGFAPAVLAYHVGQHFINAEISNDCIFVIAMVMAAFSALRLAKFNCDERQALSFIGLPTPANALFWIGMTQVTRIPSFESWISSIDSVLFACVLFVLVLVMSFLLISEIPMFSLKIKPGHMTWGENRVRYSFLVIVAVIFAIFGIIGQLSASLAIIIPLYILMSLIDKKK